MKTRTQKKQEREKKEFYDANSLTLETRLNRFQAAKFLGISTPTLWRRCKAKKISIYKDQGRIFFKVKDLVIYQESLRCEAE